MAFPMRPCVECGARVDDARKFCTRCGNPVLCPRCGTPRRTGAAFCTKDGHRFSLKGARPRLRFPAAAVLALGALLIGVAGVRGYRASRLRRTEAAYAAGNAAFSREALDEAFAAYTRALAVTPGYVMAYVKRGMVRMAMNDVEGAVADFDKATALDPRCSEAYFGRGILRWVRGEPDRAAQELAKAVELDPDDKVYYDRLSTALYEAKRDAEVEALYRGAYEADPARDWALWGWLEALHARDDFEGLKAACARLGGKGADSAALAYHEGVVALHEKRYEDVVRRVDDALRLDPDETPSYADTMLWTAHQKLGHYNEAERYRARVEALSRSHE